MIETPICCCNIIETSPNPHKISGNVDFGPTLLIFRLGGHLTRKLLSLAKLFRLAAPALLQCKTPLRDGSPTDFLSRTFI